MDHTIKYTDHNGQKYIMEQTELPDNTKEQGYPNGPTRDLLSSASVWVTLTRNFHITSVLADASVKNEYAGHSGKLLFCRFFGPL